MADENNGIKRAHFVEAVAYLLRETFEGSPPGVPSAYLDRGAGFFSTIDALSAAEASKEFHGSTIAAQTEHAKFYLDRLCEFLNGRTANVNWEDSWLIETVDDAEWASLRETVRTSYQGVLRCLADIPDWNERHAGMAVGMVAHTAYHLGAIRQMAKFVR
jgi:hypothetical protein